MPDQPRRRIPGLGFFIAIALLVASIAGARWICSIGQKVAKVQAVLGLADLDVVCLGRVDGLTPVASLEPSIPGKVARGVRLGRAGRDGRDEAPEAR